MVAIKPNEVTDKSNKNIDVVLGPTQSTMVAVVKNPESRSSAKQKKIDEMLLKHHREVPTRSDMIVRVVYNLSCTPLALGLLYHFCVTDWVWILVDKVNLGKMSVFFGALIASRLILWAVLYCSAVLGLRITTKENVNQLAIIGVAMLMGEPILLSTPRTSCLDKEAVVRFRILFWIVDFVLIVSCIATCFGIYYSPPYQYILSNMYSRYTNIPTYWTMVYVSGLTFWFREYIRFRIDKHLSRGQPWHSELFPDQPWLTFPVQS